MVTLFPCYVAFFESESRLKRAKLRKAIFSPSCCYLMVVGNQRKELYRLDQYFLSAIVVLKGNTRRMRHTSRCTSGERGMG